MGNSTLLWRSAGRGFRRSGSRTSCQASLCGLLAVVNGERTSFVDHLIVDGHHKQLRIRLRTAEILEMHDGIAGAWVRRFAVDDHAQVRRGPHFRDDVDVAVISLRALGNCHSLTLSFGEYPIDYLTSQFFG